MGSLGPAESSYTSMPSPRQDGFMAARVQSGAPPTAVISGDFRFGALSGACLLIARNEIEHMA